MLEALKEETVGFLFNLQVEAAEPEPAAEPPVQVSISNGGPLAGSRARARAAAAAAAQQQSDANQAPAGPALAQLQSGNAIPPALRGKGLDGRAQQGLTYTGPSESGDAETSGNAPQQGGAPQPGGTRKERRAAARAQAKGQRKGPRE